jgi:Uma2 family endonuclease
MTAMSAQPERHRFTTAEYHHMGESGLFSHDQRLELLGGEVIEMSPIGSRHAGTVNRLSQFFLPVALSQRAIITVQNPVRLSDLSEAQPDLTLLRWRPDFYTSRHPTADDVLLLVEVSDSSASWDRTVKRPFYSLAGIPETWLVDLGTNLVEVATDPGTDDYHQVRPVGAGGIVTPLAFPDLALDVAELLALG